MKTVLISLMLLGSSVLSALAQTEPVIKTREDGVAWTLSTKSSVYHLGLWEDQIISVYYGDKAKAQRSIHGDMGNEIPVRGGFVEGTPMLEVVFPDQVRDIELTYVKADILPVDADGYHTLKITQRDKYYPLDVISYIRVLPEYDLIEKWVEVCNTGKKGTIKVENLQSGTVYLPKDIYELTHFSGIWGREMRPQTTELTMGVKTLQVKDFRSFGSSTFIVRPKDSGCDDQGPAWFGTIDYSGNWRLDFEKSSSGNVQITGGMNFWDQEINLHPGENVVSPKIVFGYTRDGEEGVTHLMTDYIREKIQPATHRGKIRPVVYNSWYVTWFGVNEENQVALAEIAKDLGVEMFVMDDGWFKGRISDNGGLGDWEVDKEKFPNGLSPMIDRINAMGLDFALWIEPEMVNPNSDLYRAHPDWVFHFPTRTRHEARNQLMLNLAREDVCEYLYECYAKLLRENNIKYIKWDMNRPLSEPGFPSADKDEQRAVRVRYVENMYKLYDRLRSEFPDVWFENCASGGGRIDIGMMRRTDLNWLSDNTDPLERIFLQYSYLGIFPANSMLTLVTSEDWHRQQPSLAFRFDVSMAGLLGVGHNITAWSEEEKAVAREKIALYKQIRETIQNGDLYRLQSPYTTNRCVLQYVSKAQDEAVILAYNLAEFPYNATEEDQRASTVKLKGLDPAMTYSVEGLDGEFKGEYLMNIGLDLPLSGVLTSKIMRIKKI